MKRCSAGWLALGVVVTAAAIGAVLSSIIRHVNETAAALDEPEPDMATGRELSTDRR
jgi:hypothetical protein